MGTIDLDSVVARGRDHVETRMGEQVVMMSIEQGRYFALEESGQRIWELMEQPVPVRDIVDRLTEEYDVPRERCETEVLSFLEQMRQQGLVAEEAA